MAQPRPGIRYTVFQEQPRLLPHPPSVIALIGLNALVLFVTPAWLLFRDFVPSEDGITVFPGTDWPALLGLVLLPILICYALTSHRREGRWLVLALGMVLAAASRLAVPRAAPAGVLPRHCRADAGPARPRPGATLPGVGGCGRPRGLPRR